jgi:hypothetical protein
VRLFDTAAGAGVSAASPFGSCTRTPAASAALDPDGFYFIPNLASGYQYFVQVCNAGTAALGGPIDHKLADKEFEESDFTDATAPRPTALAIPHQDGKPSNGDTVKVTFSESLIETSMCSTWSIDSTQDATLTGVTVRIKDGGSGNDALVVQGLTGGACGGSAHLGSIDLGSPGYVTANADFTSSKVQWSHTGTLTITLGGTPASAPAAVTASANAVYTPDPAMIDLSGNPAAGSATQTAGGSASHF